MSPRNRSIAALVCGLIFAFGLELSGMTEPAKVIGFLDVAGDWDPSLACVMGGALLVAWLAFRNILRRSRPVLADRFHLPSTSELDGRLLSGAAIFGVGWGLAGYCPGPAIVSVWSGGWAAPVFVVAMIVGMMLHGLRSSPPHDGARRSVH